jgi:hypothetical protein
MSENTSGAHAVDVAGFSEARLLLLNNARMNICVRKGACIPFRVAISNPLRLLKGAEHQQFGVTSAQVTKPIAVGIGDAAV